jgi:Grx4 family monothiol glutaredoxin
MNTHIQEAEKRLREKFNTAEDIIEIFSERGDDRHFTLKIRSNVFEGLSPLQRQKIIYGLIGDLVSKNLIHALQFDLKTHSANQTTLDNSNKPLEQDENHYLYKLINSSPIMLFMKGDKFIPQCGFSAQIVDLLNQYKIDYTSFDILEDEQVRQDLKEYSAWPTYPQLYVNGQLIGGLDIAKELHESGELKKFLKN